jgi:glycosyltransferase involved in cell wall biosynthesis
MYFSVIIPLYNKKIYIKDSIDSVLSQSYKNFEIIVLNDGSTDGGELIVKQMQADDDRIRLISQENGGVSAARNAAISECKYDYICLLDADDDWTTDFLQVMHEMVTEFPEHKIFSVRHDIIEKNGKVILPPTGLPKDFSGELENFIKLYTQID